MKRTKAILLVIFITLAIMSPSLIACDNDSHGIPPKATPIATVIP